MRESSANASYCTHIAANNNRYCILSFLITSRSSAFFFLVARRAKVRSEPNICKLNTISHNQHLYICSSAHWVVGGRRGMSPNSGVLVMHMHIACQAQNYYQASRVRSAAGSSGRLL